MSENQNDLIKQFQLMQLSYSYSLSCIPIHYSWPCMSILNTHQANQQIPIKDNQKQHLYCRLLVQIVIEVFFLTVKLTIAQLFPFVAFLLAFIAQPFSMKTKQAIRLSYYLHENHTQKTIYLNSIDHYPYQSAILISQLDYQYLEYYIILINKLMTTNFDWVKLETQNDYKFFACVVAEKLRNVNFKAAWREAFLKTLLEEIKPVCTFRTYERIEKLLNEVANQKHQEEKEQEEKKKAASNVKVKDLKSLKIEKTKKGYDYDEDEDSYSDEDDQEF